jgi:endogenous inhibitor of DNA gyrase (YacG/DUF329 family)
MKILKQGEPAKLYGCCTRCRTVVETDAREATKDGPSQYMVKCPTCGTYFPVWGQAVHVDGVRYPPAKPEPTTTRLCGAGLTLPSVKS